MTTHNVSSEDRFRNTSNTSTYVSHTKFKKPYLRKTTNTRRLRKKLRTFNLSFLVCLFTILSIGLALIVVTQDRAWTEYIQQLGASVVTALSASLAFEFFTRKSFLDVQEETLEEQRTLGNQELLASLERRFQSIEQKLCSIMDGKAVGMSHIQGDAHNYDYSSLLRQSKHLKIVLNQGHSWLSGNRKELRRRLCDTSQITEIFFLHPDNTEAWRILARKEGVIDVEGYVESKRNQLVVDIEKIKEYATKNSNLKIYGHSLINPYSLYLADDSAVMTPYTHTGRPWMLLEFTTTATDIEESCYYYQLQEDIDNLKGRSRVLFDSSK